METIAVLALPMLLYCITVRILWGPARRLLRLGAHTLSGLACLWLLNSASGVTGFILPINAVTVLLSGVLGIPGTALVALLEIL